MVCPITCAKCYVSQPGKSIKAVESAVSRKGCCCKIAISLKTTRESAVAGYRGLLCPFKIRRMAAIVFQFRVVAGAP